jgi:hypothetical protein
MPKKSRPRASKQKRLIHAFYLAQPVLQFMALIAMLGILSRCSPLSPSTDKVPQALLSNMSQAESSRAEAEAQEQLVQKNLKEVSVNDLVIISDEEFESQTKNLLSSDSSFSEAELQDYLKRKRGGIHNPLSGPPKFLVIQLPADKQAALWRDGSVRLKISEAFPKAEGKALKLLARLLKEESDKLNLDAVGHLVLPDAAMHDEYKDISLQIRVSLAVIGEEKAVIELRRMSDEENREANATLLEPALRSARRLAITLE